MSDLCSTCLSSNRRVSPLRALKPRHVLNSIFWLHIELNIERDRVCWECSAMLLKMQQFQRQALRAQCMLALHRNTAQPPQNWESLSRLTAHTKITYDDAIVYEETVQNENVDSSEEVELKIETDLDNYDLENTAENRTSDVIDVLVEEETDLENFSLENTAENRTSDVIDVLVEEETDLENFSLENTAEKRTSDVIDILVEEETDLENFSLENTAEKRTSDVVEKLVKEENVEYDLGNINIENTAENRISNAIEIVFVAEADAENFNLEYTAENRTSEVIEKLIQEEPNNSEATEINPNIIERKRSAQQKKNTMRIKKGKKETSLSKKGTIETHEYGLNDTAKEADDTLGMNIEGIEESSDREELEESECINKSKEKADTIKHKNKEEKNEPMTMQEVLNRRESDGIRRKGYSDVTTAHCILCSSAIIMDQYYMTGDIGPEITSALEQNLGREIADGIICGHCFANVVRGIASSSPGNVGDVQTFAPETNICVWCRCSLFRRRSHMVGTGPQLQLISDRVSPRTIPEGSRVCYTCWLYAQRVLAARGTVTTPQASTNICVWCRFSLAQRRRHAIPEGPERDVIVQRIHPREIPPGGLVCYACWVSARRNVMKRANKC